MKNADLPLVIARAAPLVLRANGTTEPLAYTPDGREMLASLATLQAAVGGYIEAVAVPGHDSLVLLVNEDGLLRKLPPNPQASAVALHPIVGDAVLMPRALVC